MPSAATQPRTGTPAEAGPAQGDRSEPPARDLGWTLGTLTRAYVRGADPVLQDLPGGARAYRILVAIDQDQLPSQLALAQHVGLDRTVVTYLIDALAAAGLVQRQLDPADRRARLIVLTEDGATELHRLQDRLRLVEDHLLEGLDSAETGQLRALLARVTDGLHSAEATTCRHLAALTEAAGAGDPPGC